MTKIETPAQSPLTVFTNALEAGAVPVNPAAGPHRAFPPRLPLPEGPLPTATTGRVYSATRIEARAGAYWLALIDLDGGGRLLARLRGTDIPETVIGHPVRLVNERLEGEPRLTFMLATAGAMP